MSKRVVFAMSNVYSTIEKKDDLAYVSLEPVGDYEDENFIVVDIHEANGVALTDGVFIMKGSVIGIGYWIGIQGLSTYKGKIHEKP